MMKEMPTKISVLGSIVIVLLINCLLAELKPVWAATTTISPSNSVQSTLDAAASGDTILLNDGTYYQNFTIKKPVTVKAKNPGKAIISGANQGSLSFSSVSGTSGLYSASVSWPVYALMHGDRSLYNYGNLECLRQFTYAGDGGCSSYAGPQEGYYYDSGGQKLYVRLLNSRNPNSETIEFNRSTPSNGHGIIIRASNVTLEGLWIRLWHGKAVWVDDDNGSLVINNISIRSNFLQGNYESLYILIRNNSSYGVVVENNEFTKFPVYQYRLMANHDSWSKLYNSNLGKPAIYSSIGGIAVRHNYIYEFFDGILSRGDPSTSSGHSNEISYNVVRNIIDNPLEIEPISRYWIGRVHHNFLLDTYSTFSVTSVQFGSLLIDHNITYNSPEYGICNPNTLLKYGSNSGASASEPYGPIVFAHNTSVLCDKGGNYDSRLYSGGEDLTFEGSKIQNNIILVHSVPYNKWGLAGKVDFTPQNLVYGTNITQSIFPNSLVTDPKFEKTPQRYFYLQSSSPAIGKGENRDSEYFHVSSGATDLGAIEYGSNWNMPKPGPSWSSISSKVPMPASLHYSWLGFDQPSSTVGVTNSPVSIVPPTGGQTMNVRQILAGWLTEVYDTFGSDGVTNSLDWVMGIL